MSSSADLGLGPALPLVLPQEAQICMVRERLWGYRRGWFSMSGCPVREGGSCVSRIFSLSPTGPLSSPGRGNHKRSAGHWVVQRPPSPSPRCALPHTQVYPSSSRTQPFLAWLPWFLPSSRAGRAELGWLSTALPVSYQQRQILLLVHPEMHPRIPAPHKEACEQSRGTMEQITRRC